MCEQSNVEANNIKSYCLVFLNHNMRPAQREQHVPWGKVIIIPMLRRAHVSNNTRGAPLPPPSIYLHLRVKRARFGIQRKHHSNSAERHPERADLVYNKNDRKGARRRASGVRSPW